MGVEAASRSVHYTFTPDDRTLIVAEAWGNCLTAFDIEPDGTLKNRRCWADLKDVYPDGICLDAEGAFGWPRPTLSKFCECRKAAT